jgi:hypothetical protein
MTDLRATSAEIEGLGGWETSPGEFQEAILENRAIYFAIMGSDRTDLSEKVLLERLFKIGVAGQLVSHRSDTPNVYTLLLASVAAEPVTLREAQLALGGLFLAKTKESLSRVHSVIQADLEKTAWQPVAKDLNDSVPRNKWYYLVLRYIGQPLDDPDIVAAELRDAGFSARNPTSGLTGAIAGGKWHTDEEMVLFFNPKQQTITPGMLWENFFSSPMHYEAGNKWVEVELLTSSSLQNSSVVLGAIDVAKGAETALVNIVQMISEAMKAVERGTGTLVNITKGIQKSTPYLLYGVLGFGILFLGVKGYQLLVGKRGKNK